VPERLDLIVLNRPPVTPVIATYLGGQFAGHGRLADRL
jgi:hypothetical protein